MNRIMSDASYHDSDGQPHDALAHVNPERFMTTPDKGYFTMKKLKRTFHTLLVTAAIVLPSTVDAAVTTWDFRNVSFEDGGSVVGFVDYDSSKGSFGSFNISVSGGDEYKFPTFAYTNENSNVISYYDNIYQPSFTVFYTKEAVISGRSREIRFGISKDQFSLNKPITLMSNNWVLECYNCYPGRRFASLGTITPRGVGAVPEPATWAMMLVGFGLIGGASRYRRKGTRVVFA